MRKRSNARRLATGILARNDPTRTSLEALAVEFDAAAAVLDARTAAALAIGYGDDIPPQSQPPLISN